MSVPTLATVYRPDGKSYYFANNTGAWVADPDVTGKLVQLNAADGSLSGWTFTAKDASEVEHFDAKGRLVAINYAHGGRVELVYNNGITENNDNDYLLTSVIAQDGRSLQLQYNSNRQLEKLIDPAGGEFDYTYNPDGLLSSVAHPGGGGKTYLYNESEHNGGGNFSWALTGIVDELNARFATFKYNAYGQAISTEHAGGVDKYSVNYASTGASTVTTPLGAMRLLGVISPHGTRRVSSMAETANGITHNSSYKYDARGRTDTTTGADGIQRDYDIDARGLQTQLIEDVTNASGKRRVTQSDWHPNFNVLTERRTYDASSAVPGTLASRHTWTYNDRGQATASCQIDVDNPTAMAYVCGSAANAPAGVRQSRSTYCEQSDVDAGTCPRVGLLIASDGPRTDVSDVTTYSFYAEDEANCATAPTTCAWRKGDLWKVTNARGQFSEILRYDGAGRVLSQRDANGVVTDSEYTPRGWLSRRIVRGDNDASEADDRITTMDYWPTGLVRKVTQPGGSYTQFDYDAAHRLTDITDGDGNRLHYVLDNAGNRVKEETFDSTGALRRDLSRIYNQLGQLETQANASATPTVDYTYDAVGQVNTTTDALGRITDNDYDALGRLRQTIQDVAGISATTQFTYDARDNLTEVIDPKGLSTNYGYNSLGELLTLNSPDTGISGYTYDSAGNRKTQTDARGITATYSYDVLGRLTAVSYPTASFNVGYSYDTVNGVCASGETYAVGRLSRISDSSGSTQYCYDRWGQLVRKVQSTAGKSFTLRYGYSDAGRLSSVTYPSGARVDLTRNSHGQTTGIDWQPLNGSSQVLLSNVSYHAFGPAAALVYGDGRTLRRTLDLDYQPDVIEDVGNGGLSLGYGFDDAGNLVTLRDGNQSEPPLRRFGYDGLNRLESVKDGSDSLLQDYGYDATGNRTRAGATAYGYDADSHRLLDVGGTPRSYDDAGNTVAIGSEVAAKTFVYNDANRMARVLSGATVLADYVYNGKGEQVVRSADGEQVFFVYDEGGQLLGQYDGNGAAIQEYVWLDSMPVGVAANGALFYVEPDHLGTPRAVIDPVRQVAVWNWALTGEVFGADAPNQDADGDGTAFTFDLRFPGQRYDAVSGLNQNYFRDYEPGTGRYVESDPIGLSGGISTYGYVSASPFLKKDAKGLLAFGPSCTAEMRTRLLQAIVELSRELIEKALRVRECENGKCDFELAGDVARVIDNMTFSCDNTFLCAQATVNGIGYFHPTVLTAPTASQIFSPGQCGCLQGTIFHEAAHVARWNMPEDEVRRKTLGCVSCAQNVSENGGAL